MILPLIGDNLITYSKSWRWFMHALQSKIADWPITLNK